MRKLFTVFLVFTGFLRIYSQETDSMEKIDPSGFESAVYEKVLNTQFSGLVTGQLKNSLGNFASLETKESEISFGVTSIFVGNILNLKLTAASSDNVASLFNNTYASTKIGLEAQYNFLSPFGIGTSLDYSRSVAQNYKLKQAKINAAFDVDLANMPQKREKLLLDKNTLQEKQNSLEIEKKSASKTRLEEIKNEEVVLKSQIEVIDAEINIKSNDARKIIAEERNAKFEKLYSGIKIRGFNLSWVSIGLSASYNKFKLFYPDSAFAVQIAGEKNVNFEGKIQFSNYKWSDIPGECTFFWCAGLKASIGDNFSALKKKEISQTKNYGPNPYERTVTEKLNAYTGAYEKLLGGGNIYGDFFYFFFKNTLAPHIYFEHIIKTHQDPSFNPGIGIFMSVKNTSGEGVVNAEVYYKTLNAFNSEDSDLSYFERYDIGVRFSFPLKFK